MLPQEENKGQKLETSTSVSSVVKAVFLLWKLERSLHPEGLRQMR